MENGHATKSTNGVALHRPPQDAGSPWQAAAQQVEEALGGIIEALLGPALKGSLPHAKFLIEFAQTGVPEAASNDSGGEIAKLLDDLLRDGPDRGPTDDVAE